MQPNTEHEKSDELDYTMFLDDLRGIVWNLSADREMTWAHLADRARLNRKTVSRFAYGETKRPQMRTIFQLVSALDLRLAVVPGNMPQMISEVRVARRR